MAGLQYTKRALDHWKKWLPQMTKELRAAGTLNDRAQQASSLAAEQVANLMQHGLQQHEAEEIVLPETVLLPPERGAL